MVLQIEAQGNLEHTRELLFAKPQKVCSRFGGLFPFKWHMYF